MTLRVAQSRLVSIQMEAGCATRLVMLWAIQISFSDTVAKPLRTRTVGKSLVPCSLVRKRVERRVRVGQPVDRRFAVVERHEYGAARRALVDARVQHHFAAA